MNQYDPNQVAVVWGRFRVSMLPSKPVSEAEFKAAVDAFTNALYPKYGLNVTE